MSVTVEHNDLCFEYPHVHIRQTCEGILWGGLILTIPEARELYTQLTHVLEAEHNQSRLDACLAQRRQWERDADTGKGCGT